jgi:ATP-dependent exoDNAse (exonuclease V) alpha subunit
LQGFLTRGGNKESESQPKRFFFIDESSLASTNHMREFLQRMGSGDRVLLIGDIRQHLGVEAGRPFQQLHEAGMKTAKLEVIIRQKDPALKATVEMLAHGQTAAAIEALKDQGRVTQIPDSQQRVQAIARNYVARPERTLIVSPDNASRQELNHVVRLQSKETGALNAHDHTLPILVPAPGHDGCRARMGQQLSNR